MTAIYNSFRNCAVNAQTHGIATGFLFSIQNPFFYQYPSTVPSNTMVAGPVI